MRSNHVPIRVFDLRRREEGGYALMANWFVCPNSDKGRESCDVVDFPEYRHHMRRSKPCAANALASVRDWQGIQGDPPRVTGGMLEGEIDEESP